jgi:hypothetical protein
LSQRRATTSSVYNAAMVGSPPPKVRLLTRRKMAESRLTDTAGIGC